MPDTNKVGTRLIKIAVLYLIVGLGLAFFMIAAKDRSLTTVHSHVLLLGWMTMGLTGLIYLTAPACANSRLAAWHFWLHNVGLPVMMISLAIQEYGHPEFEPGTGIGSTIVLVALLLFTINVFRNLKSTTN